MPMNRLNPHSLLLRIALSAGVACFCCMACFQAWPLFAAWPWPTSEVSIASPCSSPTKYRSQVVAGKGHFRRCGAAIGLFVSAALDRCAVCAGGGDLQLIWLAELG